MTHPAVEWLLDQLASVADAQPSDHPLLRVDRHNNRLYEGGDTIDMSSPIQERAGDLQRGNFVGARHVSRNASPRGTEFDADVDAVANVRLEGLTHREYGHVDPDGTNGVAFSGLVDDVRQAVWDGREWPDAGRSAVTFTHLTLTNDVDQSADWGDYYRYEFDVVFEGLEEL